MTSHTIPIWKDYVHDFGTTSDRTYQVRLTDAAGELVYRGKAVARPGHNTQARLNDIFADWLTHTLPTLAPATLSALQFPIVFYFLDEDTSDEHEFKVLPDWSYDDTFNPVTMGLAFPVDGMVHPDQWMLFSAYDVASIDASFTQADGTIITDSISLQTMASFDDSFNNDFERSLRTKGNGTACFKVSDYGPVVSVEINGVQYKVAQPGCGGQYALLYVNAYGGWDTLLCSGNDVRTDGITRQTLDKSYDNTRVQNRGRVDYLNEVTRTYTLRTPLLNDEQSARMWHVTQATEVFLQDLVTGEVRPVILTDAQQTWQTFRGNGGRMPIYTLTAEVAQYFERR